MKNLKKVLAVMTAVTAMAASTSAFAANIAEVSGGVAGTYADGKLSVTTPAAADTTKGDMTLLVLTEGALTDDPATANVDESAVADGEILYIDQGTVGFAGLGLKTDVLGAVTAADGHIIKVGYYDANGNFAIAQGVLTVTAEQDEEPKITVKWGDINGNGTINLGDAVAALMNSAGIVETYTVDGQTLTVGTSLVGGYKWGDINANGTINLGDAVAALMNSAGIVETYTVNGVATEVGTELELTYVIAPTE